MYVILILWLQVDLPTWRRFSPECASNPLELSSQCQRFSKSYKIHRPHETNNHTSIRVSFRDAYNARSAHGCGKMKYEHSRLAKKWKMEKAETHEVRRGFTFPTDFSRNSSHQGHKTLRLRSEMCLLKTLIIPSGQTLSLARRFTTWTSQSEQVMATCDVLWSDLGQPGRTSLGIMQIARTYRTKTQIVLFVVRKEQY